MKRYFLLFALSVLGTIAYSQTVDKATLARLLDEKPYGLNSYDAISIINGDLKSAVVEKKEIVIYDSYFTFHKEIRELTAEVGEDPVWDRKFWVVTESDNQVFPVKTNWLAIIFYFLNAACCCFISGFKNGDPFGVKFVYVILITMCLAGMYSAIIGKEIVPILEFAISGLIIFGLGSLWNYKNIPKSTAKYTVICGLIMSPLLSEAQFLIVENHCQSTMEFTVLIDKCSYTEENVFILDYEESEILNVGRNDIYISEKIVKNAVEKPLKEPMGENWVTDDQKVKVHGRMYFYYPKAKLSLLTIYRLFCGENPSSIKELRT